MIDSTDGLPWLPDLLAEVQKEFQALDSKNPDYTSALQHERCQIEEQCAGWMLSLANPKLPATLRGEIETKFDEAATRRNEIDVELQQQESVSVHNQRIVDATKVLERLSRLDDVLAQDNPTLGNLELSMVIDRVTCHSDGTVVLRMCKLGLLPDAIDVFASLENGQAESNDAASTTKLRGKPRRRARLKTNGMDNESEARARAEFVADPNRFAGLKDEWFWVECFHVPEAKTPWYIANAEEVFRRRQESKLSFDKLADEFGTTDTTIRAAMAYYLKTHPGERDNVDLPRGRGSRCSIDVGPHVMDVRRLWDEGDSKLGIGKILEWPESAVNRALRQSYAQEGKTMPTAKERRQQQIDRARQLFDGQQKEGKVSLSEIALKLHVSDVTAREYLQKSFTSEGKALPDLRGWRRQSA